MESENQGAEYERPMAWVLKLKTPNDAFLFETQLAVVTCSAKIKIHFYFLL